MTLYVRHLAWLRAIPDDDGDKKITPKSRLKIRKERDIPTPMPDIEGFEIVIEWLSELGYANRSAQGLDPLTYQDVKAWCEVSYNQLDPWMMSLLVVLSREYSHQSNISQDKKCVEPYQVKMDDAQLETFREKVVKKIKRLF